MRGPEIETDEGDEADNEQYQTGDRKVLIVEMLIVEMLGHRFVLNLVGTISFMILPFLRCENNSIGNAFGNYKKSVARPKASSR